MQRATGFGRRRVGAITIAVAIAALLWAGSVDRMILPFELAGPPDPEVRIENELAHAGVQGDGFSAASGEATDPSPAVDPPADTAPFIPSFDLVRVSPEGRTVVAGRAGIGDRVAVRAGGDVLADVTADSQGNFVAIFDAPVIEAPRALTLEAEDGAGARRASEDVVLLLPPAPAAPPGPDGSEVTPGGDDRDLAATAILRADGVEVAPIGTDAAPGAARDVTLASISYGGQGEVTLSGIGTAGAQVRVYVDDSFAEDGAVGSDGQWSLEISGVDAGVYRLRVDQLKADGTVASRVETPFQRDFPTSGPRPRIGVENGTIVVQPGNNLWTLARTHLGSGTLYTQIFTANRELIRDPALIYPGQIFALPELTEDG